MLCTSSDLNYPLKDTAVAFQMDISPLYDVNDASWVVAIEDVEISAKSLRELQRKLPGAKIQDYYPNGFDAPRNGFLEQSTHVPFIIYQKSINFGRPKVKKPFVPLVEEKEPSVEKKTTRELVIELVSHGLQSPAIAEKLNLSRATIQTHILQLRRAGVLPPVEKKTTRDLVIELASRGWQSSTIAAELKMSLRTIQDHVRRSGILFYPGKYRRVVHRTQKNHVWTDADDLLLRQKARAGFKAREIAELIGCTRNAVIGRGHRRNVTFHGGHACREV